VTLDSLGVLDALAGAPEQLATAHAAAEARLAGLDPGPAVEHVVIAGMGGSGIVGDLVAAVGSDRLPVPVVVRKQYRVPAFVGPRSLVIAVSCSGDTEETVEFATGAAEAGARLVTVAGGGELARLGEAAGLVHLPVVAEVPGPRFALGAALAPVLALLGHLDLLPDVATDLAAATAQLARRRDECAADVPAPTNPARDLARRIDRTIPLVYGHGALGAAAALRWKQSVNENAKAPAFWNQYPELDHNEICGWGQHGDVTRQVLTLVELRHEGEHPRLARRSVATLAQVEETVAQVCTVDARGTGRLAQVLDLVHLGDWTSVHLALANDVDPGPIDAIAQLKAYLAAAPETPEGPAGR
jgi:glucose/mannose-6-phosphate isomerase